MGLGRGQTPSLCRRTLGTRSAAAGGRRLGWRTDREQYPVGPYDGVRVSELVVPRPYLREVCHGTICREAFVDWAAGCEAGDRARASPPAGFGMSGLELGGSSLSGESRGVDGQPSPRRAPLRGLLPTGSANVGEGFEDARSGLRRDEFEHEALPHLEALYRFALKLTSGSEMPAEDLVQEAYLRACRRWHAYQPGTNCRAWLMTILYRLYVDWWRRERLWTDCGDAPLEEAGAVEGEDLEADVFDTLLDEEVQQALGRLPEKLRVVVTLSDIEGLTYREVAQVLEIAEGTVKSRLSRARAQLRRTLLQYAQERGFLCATPGGRAP